MKKVIRRQVLFSDLPVAGYYKYKDFFQILPLPEELPSPVGGLEPNRPFVLELKVDDLKYRNLKIYRSYHFMRDLGFVLNVLLKGNIELLNRRTPGYKVWVCDDKTGENRYLQPFYDPGPNFYDGNEFSDVSKHQELTNIEASEYFSPFRSTRELDIPDNLGELLDKFFDLSTSARKKFLLSCFWVNQAYWAGKSSSSVFYALTFTAIESLFDRSSTKKSRRLFQRIMSKIKSSGVRLTSEEKNLLEDLAPSKHSPTVGYRKFIESFGDGLTKKEAGALYNLRSLLIHGKLLLPSDRGSYWPPFRYYTQFLKNTYVLKDIQKLLYKGNIREKEYALYWLISTKHIHRRAIIKWLKTETIS